MMQLRLKIKVAPGGGGIAGRAARSVARALGIARPRVAALVVDRAQQAVDAAAPPFAASYKRALSAPRAVDVADSAVTLTIVDPKVAAVERGAKGFDLKRKLLAHAKKFSKTGGPYVDVPFTHKAGSIPQRIRAGAARAAKQSGAAEVRVEMMTRGKSFVRHLQRGSVAQALGAKPKKQSVQHKRGIHDDMVRISSKRSKQPAAVRYMTVRRISARSAPTSWQHPGFKAARVLDKVLPNAKRDIAAILRDALATTRSGA